MQAFLKKYVFKKMDFVQNVLTRQGPFVTGLIVSSVAIILVKIG